MSPGLRAPDSDADARAPRLRAEGAPLGVLPPAQVPNTPAELPDRPARLPSFEPVDTEADVRLFPPEGSAEGCASGECLPGASSPVAASESPSDETSEDDAPPAPDSAPSGTRDDLSLSLTDRWRQAVEVVRRVAPRQGASLAYSRLLWIRPGEVAIAFQVAHGFHKATVVTASSKATIEKCFSQHFGRPTVLKVETAPAPAPGTASANGVAGANALPGPSIAEQEQEVRRRRDQETEATVRTHPAVRAALKLLGGEIEHIQMLEPAPPPSLSLAEGPATDSSVSEDA